MTKSKEGKPEAIKSTKKPSKTKKKKSSGGNRGVFVKLAKSIRDAKPSMTWNEALKEASKKLKADKEKANKKFASSIQTIIDANKKYFGSKTASSLEKDAKQPAKPIGKRRSKKGKTYYEYRTNRTDVKQPPKSFPMLEKGGNVRSKKVLQSIIDEVEKEGKRPSTAYYNAKAELDSPKMAKGGNVKFRKLAKGKNFDIITDEGRYEIEMGAFGMPKNIIVDGTRKDINTNPIAKKYRAEIQDYLDANYEKGGNIDLFDNYETLPKKVRDTIDFYMEKYQDGDYTYEDSKNFLEEMQKQGYTFEYGLDNEPYDLRKMAKGGDIDDDKKPSGIKFDDSPMMQQLWNERGYDIPYLESLSKRELRRDYDTEFFEEKEYNKPFYDDDFEKGGKIGFEGLVKKVAKNYEGKKVKPKFQDEYGKTYDKEEAMQVGRAVAGKVLKQQNMKKMEDGGIVREENIAYQGGLNYGTTRTIAPQFVHGGNINSGNYYVSIKGKDGSDTIILFDVSDADARDIANLINNMKPMSAKSGLQTFEEGGAVSDDFYARGGNVENNTFVNLLKDNGFKERRSAMGVRNFYNPKKDIFASVDDKNKLVEIVDDNTIQYSGYSVRELSEFLSKNKFAKGGKVKEIEVGNVFSLYNHRDNEMIDVKVKEKYKSILGTNTIKFDDVDGEELVLSEHIFRETLRDNGYKEYAKGGKTQGYNARLDESLGNRKGKEITKQQSKKDRRDESKGMEKGSGRRAYSSVSTMDVGDRKMEKGGMTEMDRKKDSPFSVEVWKTKARYNSNKPSLDKEVKTYDEALEIALSSIDDGAYKSQIMSEQGYLWEVDKSGVKEYAKGGKVKAKKEIVEGLEELEVGLAGCK